MALERLTKKFIEASPWLTCHVLVLLTCSSSGYLKSTSDLGSVDSVSKTRPSKSKRKIPLRNFKESSIVDLEAKNAFLFAFLSRNVFSLTKLRLDWSLELDCLPNKPIERPYLRIYLISDLSVIRASHTRRNRKTFFEAITERETPREVWSTWDSSSRKIIQIKCARFMKFTPLKRFAIAWWAP